MIADERTHKVITINPGEKMPEPDERIVTAIREIRPMLEMLAQREIDPLIFNEISTSIERISSAILNTSTDYTTSFADVVQNFIKAANGIIETMERHGRRLEKAIESIRLEAEPRPRKWTFTISDGGKAKTIEAVSE